MINKYSNSYYEYIRPNEFLIALFILIFLIFFPTSSFFFKIILTWVILFIIFRQITNSLSIALFISLGLSFLLLIYKVINPYSLVLEGYDNANTDANTEKHIPTSFPSDDSKPNESLDEIMKNDDDEDSEEDDGMDSFAGPKDVDGEDTLTPQKLRKDALYNQEEIRKGQKDLYTINKGIRELKASLSSLGPALKDSKNVLNLFKDFDLFKNIS